VKKSLYILTDSFPYGEAEKSFLMPEIEYLKDYYNITIISCATMENRMNREMETMLDKNIKVIHYELGDVKGIEVFKYFIPFISDKETWNEIGRIFKSGKNMLVHIKKCMFFYANAYKLHKWMKQRNLFETEVIYYSYWFNYHVLSIVMESNTDKQIITRTHAYDLYKEPGCSSWQPYKQYMDKNIDRIVFISQNGYDYYMTHFVPDKIYEAYSNPKYQICRLGTDRHEPIISDTRKKGGENTFFLLVSCSAMVPRKRVELIINGLSLLRDENIRWIHFGTGKLNDKLMRLANDKLDDKSNIQYEFKGFAANDKIMEYYSSEKPDCFINTSENEGSPVSIQEAISFGIPIIGTNIDGIPEMIDGNGILLPFDMEPMDVAEAIMKIYYMDSDSYISMRKRSFEIWEKDYDRKENLGRFRDIIRLN
jgi:glycosyltransferase involved in cell wall biosynthesis